MKYAGATYAMILAGAVLWCAAIVLAPIFAASSGILKEIGAMLYAFFSPICHQIDERSFCISGLPFGVCHRCCAIYCGFLIGTLSYSAVRDIGRPEIPSRWLLAFAWIPIAIDAFPWRFGLYEATLTTRAISGGIVGLTLAFFIVPAAIQAVSELANARSLAINQQEGASNATKTR
jgi:uncharacterized membrane protein